MASLDIVGVLKLKHDTVQVSEKFSKREFVVTTDASTQYPQHLSIQLTQDKCGLIDAASVGDEIKVGINLRGREWSGPEGVRYFNSLEAWRVEVLSIGHPAQHDQPAPGPSGPTAPVGEIQPEDDLPF